MDVKSVKVDAVYKMYSCCKHNKHIDMKIENIAYIVLQKIQDHHMSM